MQRPIRFVPFHRPMVWGGQRFRAKLGMALPSADAYGEIWQISDHPLHRSIVADGPLAGRSLRDLMRVYGDQLLGAVGADQERFPWLIKLLDASEWLSVQVHPDDRSVKRLWPGESGKTEAWFVLDAEPGSAIYAGLQPGVDEARLRAALAAGTVADCLHRFEPRPGDCVFLPAGTVHAVGGGVLLAEVQQTSDATFRLFDWNRRDAQGKPRPLHIEESIAAIDWTQRPIEPVHLAEPAGSEGNHRHLLVDCQYFRLEYVTLREPVSFGGTEQLQALIVLNGAGNWLSAEAPEPLHGGESWLLPASLRPCVCQPDGEITALLCTMP